MVATTTAYIWVTRRMGKRRHVLRDFRAIRAYHEFAAALDQSNLLDDRTWDDLNLDAVFALLDRTESTIGQQLLYRRLRNASRSPTLDSFEILVSRLSTDAPLRERAQMVLSRLRDSAGYDLWWLTQPNAVETRSWYALFPLLALAMVILAALTSVWSWAAKMMPFSLASAFHFASQRRNELDLSLVHSDR